MRAGEMHYCTISFRYANTLLLNNQSAASAGVFWWACAKF